jgi:hypothetical protein
LFEAKETGYASKPDGTPRSDEEIVSAVTGGTTSEKLAALAELEQSGVLSRDFRGVLYSRRLARLGELSETRSKNGSKGGSKAQANLKQKTEQTDKQNRGVSDSVSDSVSTVTSIVEKPKKQSKPTLEEVIAYSLENHSEVDPEAFWNFYEANGWVQGKNKPIKNWTAAFRTWERKRKEQAEESKPKVGRCLTAEELENWRPGMYDE